jgi:hypothetical protein
MDLARDFRRRRRVIDQYRPRAHRRQRALGPSATARTSASLPTHIITSCAPAAAAAGVGAVAPPYCSTQRSALSGVRL